MEIVCLVMARPLLAPTDPPIGSALAAPPRQDREAWQGAGEGVFMDFWRVVGVNNKRYRLARGM